MNCKDVESFFSDYIDEILDCKSVAKLEGHLRFCPACRDTLTDMHQVRMTLRSLGTGSPAGFKLRLSNRLQEEVHRERWVWLRPVAWGFSLATALAILLWPESTITPELADSIMQSREEPAWAVPVADRQLGHAWREQFVELSGSQSHAHMRSVSF